MVWKDKQALIEHNKKISKLGVQALKEKYTKEQRVSWLMEGWKKAWKNDENFKNETVERCKRNSKLGGQRMGELLKNPEFKKNISEKNKQNALRQWQTMKNKMCESMKNIPHPWASENGKKGAKKMSEIRKLQWQDVNFRSKIVKAWAKAQQIKPNKQEKQLNEFLQTNFPNEFKFVGDGQVVIEGFCPDFINCNGKKQIIELFGDYWHKKSIDKDKRRLEAYSKYGYQTLIVWENELKDKSELLSKINAFVMGMKLI